MEKKTHKLSEIATVTNGLYASKQPLADTYYIQVNDFDLNGTYKHTAVRSLRADGTSERNILKDGDILFASKGSNNYAAVYRDEFGQAIASSSFIVLRIRPENDGLVLPEFLAWQLMIPAMQADLKRNAVGTSIQSISVSQLSDMIFKVPSLEIQRVIVKAHQLSLIRIDLQMQLAQLEKTFLQTLLLNSI